MTMFCPQCKMEVVVKNGCCQMCGLTATPGVPCPQAGKGEGLPRSWPEEVGGSHCHQGLQVTAEEMDKAAKDWRENAARDEPGDVSYESLHKPEEVGGSHYQQGLQVTPWDLQKTMKSTGLSYADGRIFDVIKYVWRDKGDMAKRLEDLRKARHCLDEAIKALEGKQPSI